MTEKQSERATRLERLHMLKAQGVDPYPSIVARTHTVKAVLDAGDSLKETHVVLVGRVRALRSHGKTTFLDIEDGTGKMQIYAKYDNLKDGYDRLIETLDVADFIEAKGTFFRTKVGEPTLLTESVRIIAKALEPLPEKWHGLQDPELRYRKRYLDFLVNTDAKKAAETRIALTQAIREFFNAHGFMEVETPILQPIAGGASARPFVTHHNALGTDFYLRVAPELYLKRLIVGGFEKVYEIARCFRNEGMDRAHNPEFTQIEFYWAYADYRQLMQLSEELMTFLLERIVGSTTIILEGKEINCKPPYPRMSFQEALEEKAGIQGVYALPDASLVKIARDKGIEVEAGWGRGRLYDELWKHLIRPAITSPVFLIDHPLELSPLAKRKADNPALTERFQLIIGGVELINAFSELNDPIDQEERFREQEKAHEAGDEEAQRYDEDFIDALRHGMPPTAGFGMGIDRLAALLAGTHAIKEVILFPTLRPKINDSQNILLKATNREPQQNNIPHTMYPRENALKLLRTHVKNENLIKHMLAAEAVMRALAEKFEGNADEWGLAGLLHDIDWEETQDNPHSHSLVSSEYLAHEGVGSEVVQAIKTHNHLHGIIPQTPLEKALYSAEELTGLLVACALVQPTKKLADVSVDGVLKKFKQPSFAKGVNREIILKSEELLGINLQDLIELELRAMQEMADTLGL
ncbi:MAG: lysine--tRNA ligase [Patescibacteria group bacterium]